MRTTDWIFAVLLGVVFAPAVFSMAETWSAVDYYSHGYLIPLVALWAATAQRHLLPTLAVKTHGSGLLILGGALALYLFGLVGSVVFLQGLALVLAVAGAVLHLRGSAWLRALSFPISYLLFMIPLPDTLLAPVIVELQLFVSSVGVAALQLFGEPVLRHGNVLTLAGGESLFVAEACSGITSIVTLLPLAVFLAYFTERTLARRAVLVAAVLPLAMLGNLIRVVGTVIAAGRYGVEAATGGVVHESAGLLTYVLGCLALLGIGSLMRVLLPPAVALRSS